MADPAEGALAKFTIDKGGDEYRLHIENDAGDAMELSATQEQLELLAEALDDLLDAEEAGSADEADEEENPED